MDWNAFTAILQFLQTIAIIAALWYTWRQLRAFRQEILLNATWQMFSEIGSEEAREARLYIFSNRVLYEKLTDGDEAALRALPAEARAHAEKVCNSLDKIGYVVHQRLMPATLLLDGYYQIVVRCWVVLKPFVQTERKRRPQMKYLAYFEYLAQEAFKTYVTEEEVKRSLY